MMNSRNDAALLKIFSLLKSKNQVDLANYKLTTVKRRIQRQMTRYKVTSLDKYSSFLKSHPQALKELFEDLFIHVTEFFRDQDSYEAVKQEVFPALINGKKHGDSLRVWVPGCSTGEEAYSLAMALVEFLESKKLDIKIQIFATDISEEAVKSARKASYPEGHLKNLTKKQIQKFFDKTKDGFKVKKELREICVVSQHDLTSNPPFANLDLISCRNVLIYFGPVLQKRIMPVFHYALRPSGFLWLGKSETTGSSAKLFHQIDKKHKIYSKAKEANKNPLRSNLTIVSHHHPHSHQEVTGPDFVKSADQLLLYRYSPAGVIVDHSLEVLQFRGQTAPFLRPAQGQPTHNLLKMLHPDISPLVRSLFQKVKRQNEMGREEGLSADLDEVKKNFNLEISPLNPSAPEKERQYLVLFEEVTLGKKVRTLKGRKTTAKTKGQTITIEQLQQEIESQRDYQDEIIEQFESAQEELTSANEELQATNEELQSTNEELETAKEELQAANEELTSMNDELQQRNAELSELNEKLIRGEERFRLLVEGVRDYAIFMLDRDGKVVSWNEGARRFKGYEASEIIGQHFSKFYTPEDKTNGRPEWEIETARIEGRAEDEGWRVRKDGSKFWANVVLTRINDHSGNLIGFSKVTRDLTEVKKAQEALRRSEERLSLMINVVKDYAIFMLDTKGNIASWNEGAQRIKGYKAEEIIGKHFSIFYTQKDLDRNHPEEELKIVDEVGRYEEEAWRVKKDGSKFWANVVITKLTDSSGTHIGYVKITRDLTEKKKAEEALRMTNQELERRVFERTRDLATALNVRDEFLSIASHELKTPLTSMKLQFQMIRRKIDVGNNLAPKPSDIANALDLGLKQVNSLAGLVEDLLDVSKIQTGKFDLEFQEVNLASVLKDVVQRYSHQLASVECSVQLDVDDKIIGLWDRRRLEQVIVNILNNAIKYAPQRPIEIHAKALDGIAELVIQDHGPGIEREKQKVIFERFERVNADRHIGGLGLGLFIVKKIIEAHKGSIHVESEVGQGARFVIRLPFH